MIGLGCAPIYPCLIHSTPDHFGADKSQAIIGIQMACAYVGSSLTADYAKAVCKPKPLAGCFL